MFEINAHSNNINFCIKKFIWTKFHSQTEEKKGFEKKKKTNML